MCSLGHDQEPNVKPKRRRALARVTGSFAGPARERAPRPKRVSVEERRALHAALRSDVLGEKAEVPDDIEQLHLRFEPVPPNQQQLPDYLIKERAGLPNPESLYYSSASER